MKASDYLAEPVVYGGEVLPRGKVIEHLESCGLGPRVVDRYLQGLALGQANGTAPVEVGK